MELKEFEILAISPLDGRYAKATKALQQYVSEYGLIRFRVQVEIEWLLQLGAEDKIKEVPVFTKEETEKLRKLYQDFAVKDALRIKEIESVTNHDVKAVEYWIDEQLDELGKGSLKSMVHFACTSDDINNMAYALLLSTTIKEIILPSWEEVAKGIKEKAILYKDISLLAKTHGQPASPTTIGKELYNVFARLERQIQLLQKQEVLGKMNGAVGNFNAHIVSYPDVDWVNFSKKFVTSFGLTWNPYTTQIEPHDYMSEIFHSLMRFNTILLDFAKDMWGYISRDLFTQKVIKGQVGSSTMPHKVNPINFENSEGNLGIANSLLSHLASKLPISRWQRDLTDSTVLRNLGAAIGYCTLAYHALNVGLSKVEVNEKTANRELDEVWQVLAEPIQMVMRRYGIPNAYEKLKDFSRGQALNQEMIAQLIATLDLPDEVKEQLIKLTPQNYIGIGSQFI